MRTDEQQCLHSTLWMHSYLAVKSGLNIEVEAIVTSVIVQRLSFWHLCNRRTDARMTMTDETR